jgi:hypothetical protein
VLLNTAKGCGATVLAAMSAQGAAPVVGNMTAVAIATNLGSSMDMGSVRSAGVVRNTEVGRGA